MATNEFEKALNPESKIELTINGNKEEIILKPHTIRDYKALREYIKDKKLNYFIKYCGNEKSPEYYKQVRQIASETVTDEELNDFTCSPEGVQFIMWRVLIKNDKFKNLTLVDAENITDGLDPNEIEAIVVGLVDGVDLPLEKDNQGETP